MQLVVWSVRPALAVVPPLTSRSVVFFALGLHSSIPCARQLIGYCCVLELLHCSFVLQLTCKPPGCTLLERAASACPLLSFLFSCPKPFQTLLSGLNTCSERPLNRSVLPCRLHMARRSTRLPRSTAAAGAAGSGTQAAVMRSGSALMQCAQHVGSTAACLHALKPHFTQRHSCPRAPVLPVQHAMTQQHHVPQKASPLMHPLSCMRTPLAPLAHMVPH
jgi:hypothetical protein